MFFAFTACSSPPTSSPQIKDQLTNANATPRSKGPTLNATPRSKGSTLSGRVLLPSGFSILQNKTGVFKVTIEHSDFKAFVMSDQQGHFKMDKVDTSQRLTITAQGQMNQNFVLKAYLDMAEELTEMKDIEISSYSTAMSMLIEDMSQKDDAMKDMPISQFSDQKMMAAVKMVEAAILPMIGKPEATNMTDMTDMTDVKEALSKARDMMREE